MPGLWEVCWFELRCHTHIGDGSMILFFGFGGRDVDDRSSKRRWLTSRSIRAWRIRQLRRIVMVAAMDDLGLVKTVDRLS